MRIEGLQKKWTKKRHSHQEKKKGGKIDDQRKDKKEEINNLHVAILIFIVQPTL